MSNNPLDSSNLRQFSGSENMFYHPLFRRVKYTDGVQYIHKHAGWIVTDILSHIVVNPLLKGQDFLSLNLKISGVKGQQVGKLTITDGNDGVLDTQVYDLVIGVPSQEIKFFFTNGVLMLSSEY